MAKIRLYSTPECPKCMALKAELPDDIEMVDMREPSALTDLRCAGVFTLQAPILEIDGDFFTVGDLFKNENVDVIKIRRLLQRYGFC